MADGRGQEYSRPEKLPQRAPIKVNTQDAEEKILLAMLTDRPKLIRLMKPYLSPDDFTSPVCHSIAEMVWKQSENGEISEAEIIGHFETAEEQSEAATVFHADLAYKSDEERRKAFEDVYFRMKRKSIDTRFDSLSDSDAGGFMKLMDERKKLDELARKGLPAEIFQSLK